MAAASAATGFRSWLQTHNFSWLTAGRLRGLTIGAMCAAGLVSTIGFSGSTPASATAHTSLVKAHVASASGSTIRHTSALR